MSSQSKSEAKDTNGIFKLISGKEMIMTWQEKKPKQNSNTYVAIYKPQQEKLKTDQHEHHKNGSISCSPES